MVKYYCHCENGDHLTLLLYLSPSRSLTPCSDYGYMPADGFNGPCVRDDAVPLDDPCADGQVKTVMKSRGYRKIAGDVCTSGLGADFEPYEFTCCVGGNVSPNGSMATTAGEGAATTNSRGNGVDSV